MTERRAAPAPSGGRDAARVSRDLVLVGRLGSAHGVRGQVRIKSFTADPLSVGSYGPLTDAQGMRTFAFASLRRVKDDMLVAALTGVTTREAAEALAGLDLYVSRSRLPPPDEDEIYVIDLIGTVAETADGAAIGNVVNVLNHGAGDILEITPAAGGETMLLPFTKAIVPALDLAAGKITVVLPVEVEAGGEA